MKKIAITGAGGQLGSELRFLSTQHPHFTFTFYNRSDLDITNREAVIETMQKNAFDYLINCAAYTAVDKAESEQAKAESINHHAAANLALACTQFNCKFIHISTDFVFDGTSSVPYTEESSTNPLSIYGSTKLQGEKAVSIHHPQAIILRTSWVYSTFGANFLKTILRLCKEKEQLNVIYDQVGTPTYARDLAEAILFIIQSNKWMEGVYHYSNEGVCSWYDFAIAIRDIAGLKTPIAPIETTQYPTPATRPKYSVLNKKKIKSVYGLSIPYWRESLQKCMQSL